MPARRYRGSHFEVHAFAPRSECSRLVTGVIVTPMNVWTLASWRYLER